MIKKIVICDLCGNEAETGSFFNPKDYYPAYKLEITSVDEYLPRGYHLCKKCYLKLINFIKSFEVK